MYWTSPHHLHHCSTCSSQLSCRSEEYLTPIFVVLVFKQLDKKRVVWSHIVSNYQGYLGAGSCYNMQYLITYTYLRY